MVSLVSNLTPKYPVEPSVPRKETGEVVTFLMALTKTQWLSDLPVSVVKTEYLKEVCVVVPEPVTVAPRKFTVHSVLVASPAQSPEVGAGVVVAPDLVVVGVAVVGAAVVGAAVVGAVVELAGAGVAVGVLLHELPHSITWFLVAFTNLLPVEVMRALAKVVPQGPQRP